MKSALPVAFGVLFGLLAAGLVLLLSSPPQGQPIPLLPPPTPLPLTIHISGAVLHPGVYQLAHGSRCQDAVQAAVARPEADLEALNLARPLEDGQRLYVPSVQQADSGPSPGAPMQLEPAQGEQQPGFPLNINTASLEELDRLPGVGPAIAGRIVQYREQNGFFQSVEEIEAVAGIGPATYERMKDLITVDGP